MAQNSKREEMPQVGNKHLCAGKSDSSLSRLKFVTLGCYRYVCVCVWVCVRVLYPVDISYRSLLFPRKIDPPSRPPQALDAAAAQEPPAPAAAPAPAPVAAAAPAAMAAVAAESKVL